MSDVREGRTVRAGGHWMSARATPSIPQRVAERAEHGVARNAHGSWLVLYSAWTEDELHRDVDAAIRYLSPADLTTLLTEKPCPRCLDTSEWEDEDHAKAPCTRCSDRQQLHDLILGGDE